MFERGRRALDLRGLVDLRANQTGFVAPYASSAALLVACEDALALYGDPVHFRAAQRRAMSRDSSWHEPARAYRALYESTLGALPA